jgi:hypothetical protein
MGAYDTVASKIRFKRLGSDGVLPGNAIISEMLSQLSDFLFSVFSLQNSKFHHVINWHINQDFKKQKIICTTKKFSCNAC